MALSAHSLRHNANQFGSKPMFRKIQAAALSALLGLGALTAAPATAQADGIYFSFGGGDARGGVFIGDRDRYDRFDRHGRHDRYGRHHRPRQAACTPRDAVDKAYRMGLRNVRVVDASRNTIRVVGRTRWDRQTVLFARAPHCPVIRAR
jgi:hypothetical protein